MSACAFAQLRAIASDSSAKPSFAFMFCQMFNDSSNEVGLRSYIILYKIETCRPLDVPLCFW